MKQSHHICLGLILWFIATAWIIWGESTAIHARTLEEIKQTQEFRICISPIHPSIATAEPAGCREDCQFGGPAYEEALVFVETLGGGITPRFLRVEWDEQFFNEDGKTLWEESYTPELLASGTCDVYPSNLTKLEWRLNKLDFVPLFPSRMMVIINKADQASVKTSNGLAGKVAAVEKDTSYHSWLQEQNESAYLANPITIQLMNAEECLHAVESGNAHFTLLDSDAAIWAVRYVLKNSVIAFPVGPTHELGWAFRKEDKDLQEAVKQFFAQQRAAEDSAFNRIWEKYFGMSLTKFITLMGSVK